MRLIILLLSLVSSGVSAQPHSAPDESNPIIAAIIVISQAYAIERLTGYCDARYPQYSKSIKVAQDKWLKDHGILYKKSGKIITTQIPKDERKAVFMDMKITNDEIEASLQAASKIERESWCKNLSTKFQDPQMSLLDRGQLVKSISEFNVEQK